VAALVDTNILVYRFDSRFPEKKKIATEILRRGILEDSVRVPHQAIVEFVAAPIPYMATSF
jgi:predicted nucleic acid-binding protein